VIHKDRKFLGLQDAQELLKKDLMKSVAAKEALMLLCFKTKYLLVFCTFIVCSFLILVGQSLLLPAAWIRY
jgi:hypothetical protein